MDVVVRLKAMKSGFKTQFITKRLPLPLPKSRIVFVIMNIKKSRFRGTCVVQSVKHPTPHFVSGHDLGS